ncbi:MAG: tetratricopeptide repeat protein [Rhodoferax sp.]|nr:tetratricopeptide repeat protein [Rhodoferax sp.]
MGQLPEAMAHYRETLRIRPEHVQAHINFGNAQRDSGRLGDAQASYRLALQIRPDSAAAHSNLGAILHLQGRVVEAESSYRHALRIDPMLAETHANLGNIFRERSCFVEALQCYRQGRIANPGLAIVHSNLASCVAQMSDFCEVVAVSDEALALAPNDEAIWEQRLYNLSYHPDLSAEAIYAEFVRWGDRFPEPVQDFSAHDQTPGRRLRIGYVSPDFRRHTSRFFFWPLFANHDPAAVELVAYSNVAVEDDVTQDFKGLFAHWRNIRGVPDQDVASLVRRGQIDILVDCCNHMRDARLGVFALKPAPIQATWLGAAWTTGLKAVDYALIDPYMAPEGTLTRESIVRLPHCFVAYRPPEPTPEVAPAPCLKNGFVTFGYSGRSERLNHHTFCVWGEILRQNPSARLILDFRSFADPATQDHYRAFMTRQGWMPAGSSCATVPTSLKG